VPPRACAAAAAAHPDTPLRLPDGTRAPASRVAAVLRAQTLGRLGAAEQAADWFLAMLREAARPEEASENALRAEREMLSAPDSPPDNPEARTVAAGAVPESGAETAAGRLGHAAAGAPEFSPAMPRVADGAMGEAPDPAALVPAGASIDASFAGLPASELDLEPALDLDLETAGASTDAGLALDFSAEVFAEADLSDRDGIPVQSDTADLPEDLIPPAAPALTDPATDDGGAPQGAAQPARSVPDGAADTGDAEWAEAGDGELADAGDAELADAGNGDGEADDAGDAERVEIDTDSMVLVLMRGVPEDARLSAGTRGDDGTWSLSPLDLSTVTISLASEGLPAGAGEERSGDLSITGIGFAENGELVAISETVPLADYLDDPTAGEPGPTRPAAKPADDAAAESRQRTVPLELDPQVLAGESFDALVVRDLPAGVGLSAGAYDPAIAGWVLRPRDLQALAILPPPELRADFTLTLLGIALRPGVANAARVLARLPIRLA
jgi:hypothetical protein